MSSRNRSLLSRHNTVATVAAVATLVALAGNVHAQQFGFGFEQTSISGIPNTNTTGAPAGTTGDTFSYTFVSGNNLQASSTDIDDAGSGSVPDYYKAPTFGWTMDGYVTRNNTTPQWGSFVTNYVGNGASVGIDYPGNTNAGRRSELGEAFNVNRGYSPAQGNLLKAPGLGDQFMDTWNTAGGAASQVSLTFDASQNATSRITLAFGGRDSGSATSRAYYRLLAVSGDASFVQRTGSTSEGLAMEYYLNSSGTLTPTTMTTNDTGVIQSAWEYYQLNFDVKSGARYRLQLIIPDEINFDIAVNENGANYLIVPGITVVPEASTVAWVGALSLGGLALRRRLRR